jgi:alanine-synthesizing transaminase
MFSVRVPALAPNALAQLLAGKRAIGQTVLDLTESNPTRVGLDYDQEAIRAALADPGVCHYEPDPRGMHSARVAVAQKLGGRFMPDDLILTASTSEAYSFLFKLLCDAGDCVLAPRPSYPLVEHLARLESVETAYYHLYYENGWHLDLDSVRAAARCDPRAIVVVSPNNPTGSVLASSELEALVEVCSDAIHRGRGCALVGDEVFQPYRYVESSESRSVCDQPDVLAFSMGGLSKAAGMPQLKLGWLACSGPASIRGEAMERLEFIADAYLSVNTPVQLAAGRLLAEATRIQQQIRARVLSNRRILADAVRQHPDCELLHAEGGWYAVLRIRSMSSDEALVMRLLEQDDVLVHPGYLFDFEQDGILVLSLLPTPAVFSEGIHRILERCR